jgi:hypothetical protein
MTFGMAVSFPTFPLFRMERFLGGELHEFAATPRLANLGGDSEVQSYLKV